MTDETNLPMQPPEIIAYLEQVGFWKPMQRLGVDLIETRDRYAKARWLVPKGAQRLGGTVSGPAYFTMSDTILLLALLATTGPKVMAVTTNMNINFLRASRDPELIAECELLHVGRTSVVGDVRISQLDGKLLTHASGTFRLPTV